MSCFGPVFVLSISTLVCFTRETLQPCVVKAFPTKIWLNKCLLCLHLLSTSKLSGHGHMVRLPCYRVSDDERVGKQTSSQFKHCIVCLWMGLWVGGWGGPNISCWWGKNGCNCTSRSDRAIIWHNNWRAGRPVSNVPCIMFYHMLQTSAAIFNCLEKCFWFQKKKNLTGHFERALYSALFTRRFCLDFRTECHRLLLVAMGVVFIVCGWTLTPQLIIWRYAKYDGVIIINASARVQPHYCSAWAEFRIWILRINSLYLL